MVSPQLFLTSSHQLATAVCLHCRCSTGSKRNSRCRPRFLNRQCPCLPSLKPTHASSLPKSPSTSTPTERACSPLQRRPCRCSAGRLGSQRRWWPWSRRWAATLARLLRSYGDALPSATHSMDTAQLYQGPHPSVQHHTYPVMLDARARTKDPSRVGLYPIPCYSICGLH